MEVDKASQESTMKDIKIVQCITETVAYLKWHSAQHKNKEKLDTLVVLLEYTSY